ncbi:MAG: hypothetical protein EVG15_08875 [Candidatus Acididesulfobacter diazotrophicus]|jgi:hypothetical protein|uniref:Uncharacterized protein n=1 Tax=Candidatus Acididesulfobacter diazotrophicus TaxID=2597226 RepID=A0A519BKV9_9DELT|nr:MAG: hypothetical protein EVG15_08875 [Candidatus Acididesulfobacter diazotrophicus]
MKINSIKLKNFLSFGEEETFLDNLGNLNIIVGPNNSGKTNIFRTLSLAKKIINSTNPIPDETIQYYFHLNNKSEKSNITIEFSISDNKKDIILDIFNFIFSLIKIQNNDFNIRTSFDRSTTFRNFIEGIFNSNQQDNSNFNRVDIDKFFNYIQNIFIEYAEEIIKKVSKVILSIEIREDLFNFKIYLKDDLNNCVYGFDNNTEYINYERGDYDSFDLKFKEMFQSKIKSKLQTNFEGSEELEKEIKKFLYETSLEFATGFIDIKHEMTGIDSKQIYTLYYKINDYLTKLNLGSSIQNVKNRFSISHVIRQIIVNSLIFTEEFYGSSQGSFDSISDLTNAGHEELNLRLYVLKNNYPDKFNEIKNKFAKIFNNIDFDIQSANRIDKRKVLIRDISNDADNNLNKSNTIGSYTVPEHKDYYYEDVTVLEPYIVFYDKDKDLKITFDFASSGMKELLNLLSLTTIGGIENNIIFMDEPGATFHPSMQKKFLEEIITNSKSAGQVFIITHSPYFIPSNFLDFNNNNSQIKLFRFYKNVDGVSTGFIDINKSIDNNNDLEGLKTVIRANIDKIIRAPFANLVVVVEGIEEQMSLSSLLLKYCNLNIADFDIEVIHSHGKSNVDKYSNIFKNWNINTLSIKDSDKNTSSPNNQYEYYWNNYNNYTELICSILKESINNGINLDNEKEIQEEYNKEKPRKLHLNNLLLDNIDTICKEPNAKKDLEELSNKIRKFI